MRMDELNHMETESRRNGVFERINFHGPLTVVYWPDGSKTCTRCVADDTYDPKMGFLMAFLEKKTGLSKRNIGKLLLEITDRSMKSSHEKKHRTKKRKKRVSLKPEQIVEIFRRVHAGERGVDLGKEFNVCHSFVSRIKLGRVYPELTSGLEK